ncbi:MAG: PLDc_N domain-containing protein, partial [Oscillospiraceae bacterium]|nr:PLDc_N domain-containing protein [Oscillospiraceae bacterium]
MFRKLIRLLFNRNTLFILMLLIQAAFLLLTVLFLSKQYIFVYVGLMLLDVVLAVYISNTSENPSYKMPWFLLMILFPLFSGLAYILVKTDAGHRAFKKNYARRVQETKKYIPQNKQII